jgi:hypothetical protein
MREPSWPALGAWIFDPPPYAPPRRKGGDAALVEELRRFMRGDAEARLEVEQSFRESYIKLHRKDHHGRQTSYHPVTEDTDMRHVGMILDLMSFVLQQGKPRIKRMEAALSKGSSTPNGDVGPTIWIKNPPAPLHHHRGLKLDWHSDAKEAMWRRIVLERPRTVSSDAGAAVDLEMTVIDLWRQVALSLPLTKKGWSLPLCSLRRKKAPQVLGWANGPFSLDKAIKSESHPDMETYPSIWLGGKLVVRLRVNFAGKRRSWLDMEQGWPAHVARRVLEQGALEPLADLVLTENNAFAREVLDRALAQATHRYVNEPDPFRAAADRLRELRYDGRRGAAHVYERLLGLV